MKRAFEVKYEVFFISFKGLSVATNCLVLESALLNKYETLNISLSLVSNFFNPL